MPTFSRILEQEAYWRASSLLFYQQRNWDSHELSLSPLPPPALNSHTSTHTHTPHFWVLCWVIAYREYHRSFKKKKKKKKGQNDPELRQRTPDPSKFVWPSFRAMDQQFVFTSGTIQGLRLNIFGQNLNKLPNKPRITKWLRSQLYRDAPSSHGSCRGHVMMRA